VLQFLKSQADGIWLGALDPNFTVKDKENEIDIVTKLIEIDFQFY
jgi:hypothetical protein